MLIRMVISLLAIVAIWLWVVLELHDAIAS
jgi:hypothetical protein